MNIIFAMGAFFILVTVIFVAIAIFLPEWMGITGQRAKKIIAEQQDSSTKEDSENPPPDVTKTP